MRRLHDRRKKTARGLLAAGAALFAAALLAPPELAHAGEVRLFPESAARPRYAVPLAADEETLRLVDLEHSYPWSGGESLDLGLDAPDPQEAPKHSEGAD